MRWSMRSTAAVSVSRSRATVPCRYIRGSTACISPKAGSEVVQRAGDELKLVWPQPGTDVDTLEGWDFANFLVQPMDSAEAADNLRAAIAFAMARPRWRLTLQTHKMLGLR